MASSGGVCQCLHGSPAPPQQKLYTWGTRPVKRTNVHPSLCPLHGERHWNRCHVKTTCCFSFWCTPFFEKFANYFNITLVPDADIKHLHHTFSCIIKYSLCAVGICLKVHLLTASKFKGTSMSIHWKVLQLHGTFSRDGKPERKRQKMNWLHHYHDHLVHN